MTPPRPFPDAEQSLQRHRRRLSRAVRPGAEVTDVRPIDWTVGDDLPPLLK